MAHTKPDADDYSKARFMPLSAKPATDLARDVGRKLDAVLFPACDSQQSTRGRPKNIEGRRAALLAIVADLIDTAQRDKLRWASSTGSPTRHWRCPAANLNTPPQKNV